MVQLGKCYQLTHPVGLGGRNDPLDIQVIQELLMENGLLPYRPMTYDQATMVEAIKKFQSGFLLNPDGLVSPGGVTFERLQGRGLVEMPASGGLGWYRYETGDMKKSRIVHFGTENTVKAVLEVAAAFVCGMPGYSFGVGDLSSAMGTNLGRHSTHLHGKNVDLRPMRKDGVQMPTNIGDSVNYSQDYTLLLIDSCSSITT
jgi:hypothetical protein